MSDDKDRIAALFEGQTPMAQPEPADFGAGASKHLLDYAPPMPFDFWGKVTFVYQGGRLVNLAVEETIKPPDAPRGR